MMIVCLILGLLNTAFFLYLAKEKKIWSVTLTEEEERTEQERKLREEKLNRVFDYDPYL